VVALVILHFTLYRFLVRWPVMPSFLIGGLLLAALVGYLAARSRDLLFADARYYVFIYLFAGTWASEMLLMLAMPGGPGILGGLVLAPVSALGTAVVCGAAERLAAAFRRP
jgi:hypothetical protein